ncbi:MAG: hypothetical protein VB050_05385 [Geobacteraceae bacterium]|nr:hypothetical protein [Geobacteraceae bacterium]
MKILTGFLLFVVTAVPFAACGETVTLFLDGAKIEREVLASKAYLEVQMPTAMIDRTLRVKPLGDGTVTRFDVVQAEPRKEKLHEISVLEDRKKTLADRLEVLEEREGIFAAAAKSHSSRALRKSKNNPDPVETARKGTDLALAQLSAVHAARNKLEREIASTDARLATLRKSVESRGSLARLWLSKPGCRIRIAYLVSGLKWTPAYDFRLTDAGFAEVMLRARIPSDMSKASISVAPMLLAEAFGSDILLYPVSRDGAVIETQRIAVSKGELTKGPVPFLTVTFLNTSGKNLPAGEACGYWRNEYMGKSPFSGCRPNESASLVFGKP